MSIEKNEDNNSSENSNINDDNKNSKKQPLPFPNSLKPNDHKKITQEDLDNEQKYKEALSERD